MMRIEVFYFSGTGNTAWVVRHLAERLSALGDEVTVASCETVAAADVDPAACDAIGIAFPIYASFVPRVFRDWLRDLPPGGGRPLFVLVSAGYCAGDAGWTAARPLQERGYVPLVVGNVVVANNFSIPPFAFFPVTPPEQMPERLARAGRKVDELAGFIHRGERHVEGTGLLGRALGLAQRVASEDFESRVFRPFFADPNCTRCGWCVEHCPVGNIEMTGEGPRFLDHCMLCMRCYSFCPVQAIQATARTRQPRYRRYGGPEGRRYPKSTRP